MQPDMCIPCGDGIVNIRVGAVIEKDGLLLMVESARGYYYSVGGRIRFGETAGEAIEREVFEETGVRMRAETLLFVHENYFCGDAPGNLGRPIYEISFYFRMRVPEGFEPKAYEFSEGDATERLVWVSRDTPKTIYPTFFRTETDKPFTGVHVFLTDERR